MKHKIIFLNGASDTAPSPSTLLIPLKFINEFNAKVEEFGSPKKLFNFVVNSRHPAYKNRPRPGTAKICYQPKGSNLQRIDFFPNPEDWEKFRTLALLQKVSMTLLFVILLLEWDQFESEVAVVPKNFEKIKLYQTLVIGKAYSSLELYHLIL